MNIKKLLIGLLVIALVVALGIFAWQKFSQNPLAPETKQVPVTQTDTEVEKKQVPTGQLPENFPKDIPLEAGAQVVQNFNASSKDGELQATRSFTTKKTLAENLTIYTNYMKANG